MKNTILFAVSSLLVKIMSFLLLPLYTGALSTAEYGEIELLNTTISFIMPLLTLSIAEAVIRYTFIKEVNKKSVFTGGLFITFIGIAILLLAYPLLNMFDNTFSKYFFYFMLIFATSSIEQLFFKFSKGLEKIKICAFDAVIVLTVTVVSNLVLLLKFKMGIYGYFTSIIVAQFCSCIFLFIMGNLKEYVDFKSLNRKIIKDMLIYSLPFIPTAIAWWINAASDRYVIVFMLGVGANGLYSVASKLPGIVSIITTVFNQAWQISGVKEYENEGYATFYSNIYNYYNSVMVIATSIIILLSPVLAKILFIGEFYVAWKYSPFLLISALFSGLAGVLGTVFFAVKKTKIMMISTLNGAAINIILNLVLVPIIGIQGAAIATAISFFFVWFIRYLTSRKYMQIEINWPITIASYAILIFQTILLINDYPYSYVINTLLIGLLFILNKNQYIKFVKYCKMTVLRVRKSKMCTDKVQEG